jgi:hypothetical protein
MKRFLLVLFVLFIPICLHADDIVLDSTENLAVPTATSISEWEITKINAAKKEMIVKYRWRDGTGKLIRLNRDGWLYWYCQDRWNDTNPVNNDECTAAGVPDACCTGVGTGTCDDLVQTDSCFTDVFMYEINCPQDNGTKIGVGLRTLIWNQMKADILTGGNDGTFN